MDVFWQRRSQGTSAALEALRILCPIRRHAIALSRNERITPMANADIVAMVPSCPRQIVDTNSSWMAQRLTALGVNLYFKSVVGDNPGRMKEVIQRALERADIVITSGRTDHARRPDTRDRRRSYGTEAGARQQSFRTSRRAFSTPWPDHDAE